MQLKSLAKLGIEQKFLPTPLGRSAMGLRQRGSLHEVLK